MAFRTFIFSLLVLFFSGCSSSNPKPSVRNRTMYVKKSIFSENQHLDFRSDNVKRKYYLIDDQKANLYAVDYKDKNKKVYFGYYEIDSHTGNMLLYINYHTLLYLPIVLKKISNTDYYGTYEDVTLTLHVINKYIKTSKKIKTSKSTKNFSHNKVNSDMESYYKAVQASAAGKFIGRGSRGSIRYITKSCKKTYPKDYSMFRICKKAALRYIK